MYKKVTTDLTYWINKQLSFNAINKFERKISGKDAVRSVKGFNLFISNEDIIDVTKIMKSWKIQIC